MNFSASERSAVGGRVRRFDADDLIAFALCFELPPVWFLVPPLEAGSIRPARTSKHSIPLPEFIELLISSGSDVTERRIAELSLDLRKAADLKENHMTSVHIREARVEADRETEGLEQQLRELAALADQLTRRLARARASVANPPGQEQRGAS